MIFASDNWSGVSPKLLAALAEANGGFAEAYAGDAVTLRAEEAFRDLFGVSGLTMVAVPTGTAANALALDVTAGRDGTIVAHTEAHIYETEAEGRRFMNDRAAIVSVPGAACKIAPADLEAALETADIRPNAVLSITNGTEFGALYTPDEVRALAAIAHERGLLVHMDGARFGNAVAALGVKPAEITVACGVDLLSFGATKNGALGVDALVAFDPALGARLAPARDKLGYTLSKARFASAQLLAYVEGGHWLELAGRANAMAARLAAGFAARGVRLAVPAQINEVFPILPTRQAEALKAAGARFHPWSHTSLPDGMQVGPDEGVYRFVASFNTTEAMVDDLMARM